MAALPRARAELEELTAVRAGESGDAKLDLALWDVPFWAERLREERYAYSDEELRPYFSLPKVLEGLFATAKRLFDVDVRPADGAVVGLGSERALLSHRRCERARRGKLLPRPYSRPAEQARRRVDGRRALAPATRRRHRASPVAYLVCNYDARRSATSRRS